jgi:hypothetical protein
MAAEGNQRNDHHLAWIGLIVVVALIGWQLYLGATIQEIGIPGVLTVKFGKTESPKPATPPAPSPPVVTVPPPQSPLSASEKPVLPAPESQNLPSPTILQEGGPEEYEANGKLWKRYKLTVANRASYPAELFAPAPDLPPCGLNRNSSRAWVNILEGSSQKPIYGYCALGSPEDMKDIGFSVPSTESPPRTVRVVILDRRKNVSYVSDAVELRPGAR